MQLETWRRLTLNALFVVRYEVARPDSYTAMQAVRLFQGLVEELDPAAPADALAVQATLRAFGERLKDYPLVNIGSYPELEKEAMELRTLVEDGIEPSYGARIQRIIAEQQASGLFA